MTAQSPAASPATWRTPAFIIGCGCLIALISFGPRSALGQFQMPILSAQNWGRDIFSFALAIQNLLWGIGQPLAGGVADRFGTVRVLSGGALLYAAGLALMAYSTTPGMLQISAGVLIGFGLSGCSFNLVIGALAKLVRSISVFAARAGADG
jgi:MFS family permease